MGQQLAGVEGPLRQPEGTGPHTATWCPETPREAVGVSPLPPGCTAA